MSLNDAVLSLDAQQSYFSNVHIGRQNMIFFLYFPSFVGDNFPWDHKWDDSYFETPHEDFFFSSELVSSLGKDVGIVMGEGQQNNYLWRWSCAYGDWKFFWEGKSLVTFRTSLVRKVRLAPHSRDQNMKPILCVPTMTSSLWLLES